MIPQIQTAQEKKLVGLTLNAPTEPCCAPAEL
jgi:hypothetical protein